MSFYVLGANGALYLASTEVGDGLTRVLLEPQDRQEPEQSIDGEDE